MGKDRFWSLNKAFVLLLVGGFAVLLVEIRYEHRFAVWDEKAAWIPIVFSGAMVLLTLVALALWDRGGRVLLNAAFAASLVVGAMGVWFHTDGHPAKILSTLSLQQAAPAEPAPNVAAAPSLVTPASMRVADADEAAESREAAPAPGTPATGATGAGEKGEGGAGGGTEGGKKAEGTPPALAPLAFLGLGAMGLLATSRRLPAET